MIGDVSRKGAPAARFIMLYVAVLRLKFGVWLNAGKLLNYANHVLVSFTPHSHMFVTMQDDITMSVIRRL